MYVGDEFLTLPNATREKLNPLTEGSELQISQKRPPETIEKKDWADDFNFVVTTNGSDIRDDGFSDAEASRMRIVGLRELSSVEDLTTIATREYPIDCSAPSSRTRDANAAYIVLSPPKSPPVAIRMAVVHAITWIGL